ncbi:MAG: phosphatidate cytidylyltransferase [Lachnospiraceae bacterium]|nr:phosphatidate cytidylyltransferase [Lachnospiraceae bacterium]
MKSFLTRLTSGIVLVILVLFSCWIGSWPLWLFTMLIGYIGLNEFYRVFEIKINSILGAAGMFGAVLWMWMVYVVSGGLSERKEMLWLTLLAAFMLIMAVYVFTFPKYDTQKVMAAFFGIVYVPVMLSFVYQTRMLYDGFYLVWLIFFCSWGCDTCAYCVGMLFGKHKLAPVLSPKKSIEGAVGGVVGAALLGAGYAALTSGFVVQYALICAAGAVASQVGDLAASAIKRQHGIKDYGTLIPGHGGILDRFDSVIVTAPMIYILAVLFI